ncbi:electron transfer flavoprotein alpha subunit [Clostridium saccharobutylicum]|nr:electron transfer flavoprotein alpha subunit [Clostridium saccharobutylicum]
MKALLFIETDKEKVLGGSLELISALKSLDAEGTALIVGNRTAADTVAALGIPVIFTDAATDCDTLTEVLSQTVKEENPDIVLLANTVLSKNLAPRIAGRMSLGCVSDVIGVTKTDGKVMYTRPAYGGTVLEHIEVEGTAVVTIRNGSFPKPESASNASVTEKK